MIGLLLRAVTLSTLIYILLSMSTALQIVTLGGQIAGSLLVGVWGAIFHTVSRRVVRSRWAQLAFSTLWTVTLAYLTINLLPGWNVLDGAGVLLLLVQVAVVSVVLALLIQDR
ncbi:MAG: hypothetical protein RSE47_06055 [Acidaminococcaceae bacterium]